MKNTMNHRLAAVSLAVAAAAWALPALATESVSQAASNAATASGHAIGEAGRATGHAVAETGRDTGHAVATAGRATASEAEKGTRKVKAAGTAASQTK
jgi:hypothetical protein